MFGKAETKDRRAAGGTRLISEGVGAVIAAVALAAGAAAGSRARFAARGRPAANGDPNDGAGRPSRLSPFDPNATGADEKPKGVQAKLVRFARARRWTWLGRALEVQERMKELRGGSLAAAVALRAFVSLFPLLLLITAVAGFVAGQGTDVAGEIIGQLGLTGSSADAIREAIDTASGSERATSVIGLAGLLWSALGLVAALQFAFDQMWQVEDRGPRDRVVGFFWLAGASVLFIGSAAAMTVVQWVPGSLAVTGVLGSVAVTFVLWVWTSTLLANVDVGWRAHIPGAILGTIGLEVLKAVGAFYIPRAVASSSQLYGTIGVVFAILAWLVLFARLILYSAALDVVLYEGREGTVRSTVQVPAHDKARGAVTRGGQADVAA